MDRVERSPGLQDFLACDQPGLLGTLEAESGPGITGGEQPNSGLTLLGELQRTALFQAASARIQEELARKLRLACQPRRPAQPQQHQSGGSRGWSRLRVCRPKSAR